MSIDISEYSFFRMVDDDGGWFACVKCPHECYAYGPYPSRRAAAERQYEEMTMFVGWLIEHGLCAALDPLPGEADLCARMYVANAKAMDGASLLVFAFAPGVALAKFADAAEVWALAGTTLLRWLLSDE